MRMILLLAAAAFFAQTVTSPLPPKSCAAGGACIACSDPRVAMCDYSARYIPVRRVP